MAENDSTASLNHIAENLADINKTLIDLKPDKKTPISTNKEWENRILPLIELVNENCKKSIATPLKKLGVIILVAFYFVAFIALVWQLFSILNVISSSVGLFETAEEQAKFLAEQLTTYSALSVSVVAIELSIVPIFLAFPRTSNGELADWYFTGDKISKGLIIKTNELNRPYLKALINMKCKEFDLNLVHVYHTNPELFTQEALLKQLYD